MQSHRDYMVDRNKRLDRMFIRLGEEGGKLVDDFRKDPRSFASQFGVELNEEETFASRSLADDKDSIRSLWERLRSSRLAFFDNNCSCGGGGPHSHIA
jgi:hypothetical protein